MKKFWFALMFLGSITSFAQTDIKINIQAEDGLSGIGSAIYQATKDSFLCKELVMNDGSPKFVLKRIYPQFKAEEGTIIIPKSIDSRCNFERVRGGSLAFEIKDKAEPYDVVSVYFGGGDSQVQTVQCEEIISGPANNKRKMISCFGDIKTNDEGEAEVLVLLKD